MKLLSSEWKALIFNGLLQVMLMNIEMLESLSDLADSNQKRLQKIKGSIERMQDILKKMNQIEDVVLKDYTENELMLDLDESAKKDTDDHTGFNGTLHKSS